MTADVNGAADFPVDTPPTAPPALPETRPLYWSVRRELWENRFLYIAPLIIAAFVLFGSFVTIVTTPHRAKTRQLGRAAQELRAGKPVDMAPAPIMLTSFLVGLFYCLDALYGERRDRSILFWKSLPVSDRTTVLSKAAIPLIVLPSIAYVLSIATQLILLILTTPFLAVNGLNAWRSHFFFPGLIIAFYGLAVHALWFAPIYGWLLLVSAWARRAPFLWAALPVLVLAALEWILFSTSHVLKFVGYRVMGAMARAFDWAGKHPDGDVQRLEQLAPLRFLSTPGLWIGLLFAAACLAVAIRLRRNREPI